jgi:uncharacterized membrane protein (DUF4010 family)
MTWTEMLDVALRLGVAALGGLAVGVEREWSARDPKRHPRFAGVRTFLLLGLLGGLAAELVRSGQLAAGIALLAGVGALIVMAYALAARGGDLDATTEVSAFVVLAAGWIAGMGRLDLASALFAVTALVLVEKSRIHALVDRIHSEVLEAAARFAVLALVILPLLPEGPFGPSPGFRPRELWALVLLFSGLSFAGFLALRAAGPLRGYALAGALGGLISSTLVTLNFSRESRQEPKLGRALALGVLAACTVLPVRVFVLVTVLNAPLGIEALPFLLPPFAVGILGALVLFRRKEKLPADAALPRNPLRLLLAIQMAVGFQIVLYVIHWASRRFGSPGTLASAALLGLTDVDALIYSMVKLGRSQIPLAIAARALAAGVAANTVLKLAIALFVGRGPFRAAVGLGLAAALLSILATLLLF